MKQSHIIGGLAVLAIIVAGFFYWQGSGAPGATTPEAATETMNTEMTLAQLTSNSWVWEQTVMNNDEIIEPSTPGAFTVTFAADGTLSGQTDCNGFSGGFSLDDTELTAGPFAMTMMFCEGSNDVAFANMIEEAQFVFFTDDGRLALLLPFDSGSVLFTPAEL